MLGGLSGEGPGEGLHGHWVQARYVHLFVTDAGGRVFADVGEEKVTLRGDHAGLGFTAGQRAGARGAAAVSPVALPGQHDAGRRLAGVHRHRRAVTDAGLEMVVRPPR